MNPELDGSTATAAAAWLGVVIVALTASCLVGMTVFGVRRQQPAGELLGELVLISLAVPTALMFVATHLPPDLFLFLK